MLNQQVKIDTLSTGMNTQLHWLDKLARYTRQRQAKITQIKY